MTYKIEFKQSAEKALQKLTNAIAKKITSEIIRLANDPRPAGCKKLKGSENAWRIRINDYRVVYSIIEQRLIVQIIKIGHRKDIYQ